MLRSLVGSEMCIRDRYRSRQRSIISDDSTIVGTAELENMPFSRIQGRLKLSGLPLYPTLIDTVLNSKTNVKDGEKKFLVCFGWYNKNQVDTCDAAFVFSTLRMNYKEQVGRVDKFVCFYFNTLTIISTSSLAPMMLKTHSFKPVGRICHV